MDIDSDQLNKNSMSVSGFFNHVFNFDSDNKGHLLNLFQYLVLALIPIVFMLKAIKVVIPESDDMKSTLEISIEVLIQLSVIFIGIWFIDKAVRYLPTYSGIPYYKFNVTNNVLPMLIVLFTIQTKMGAKINILYDRFINMINGKQSFENNDPNKKPSVKVNQPIVTPGIHQPSQADTMYNSTMAAPSQQLPPHTNTTLIDGLPNLSGMPTNQPMNNGLSSFQNQAIQNSFIEQMEPMAANDALGGAFGSSF